MNSLYAQVGITKQAVHQRLVRYESAREESAYLTELIRQVRQNHPTLSCQALYYLINPTTMGRDRFITFCMEHGFRVQAPRNPRRTTDSTGVVRFANLSSTLQLDRPNQLWCSDITYFELKGSFYYLTFILDAWSRRIVGWNVSARLRTDQTSLPALKMALNTRKGQHLAGLVFHSDGGGQYYDKEFMALTQSKGIRQSMCEYAWENGKAERVNGIIKNNYLRHRTIQSLPELIHHTKQSVDLYNAERPHQKLGFSNPIKIEKDWYLRQGAKASA